MFETILFNTIKVLSSSFEIVFAFILLSRFFRKRYENPWVTRALFVVCAVVVYILQERGSGTVIKTTAEILLILAVSFIGFTGKKRDRVIFVIVFSMMLAMADLLSAFCVSWLKEKITFIDTDSFFFRILNLEMPYLIMFAVLLLLSAFIQKNTEHIQFRYWVMLLTVPAITLITLTVYQFYISQLPPNSEIHAYIYISAGGLVFITILVFALFSRLQNQLKIVRDNQSLKLQMLLQEQSISKMEESYNRTRELRHDLKNHLACMNGLISQKDYNALSDYIKTMTDTVEDATYISVCGNSAVDAILNDKLILAQQNNANLRFDVCSLKNTKAKSMDLCIIISNALDNAVEAVKKIEDDEKRYIKLKIAEEESFIVISVINPVKSEPRMRRNLIESDKKDKQNHGIGLKNIKSTAQKYNGDLVVKCEDLVFTLVVKLNFSK